LDAPPFTRPETELERHRWRVLSLTSIGMFVGQLSLASGFLGTMRSVGQGLSVGLPGAIAASGLGATGARVIFLGEGASKAAALSFSDGYRTAMFVSVGMADLGAGVSLVRGASAETEGLHA
jgi:hypothetical protein